MNLSSKSCLVIDRGLFLSFALRLARNGFGKVYYFDEWQTDRPSFNNIAVGTGYEGIEVVRDMWDWVDKVDCIAFPDCYDGGLQKFLRSLNYKVWGSGQGGELEIYRLYWKKMVLALGLKLNPFVALKGLTALDEYLQNHEDRFIKVSLMRGLMETRRHKKYWLTKPWLNRMRYKLGPLGEEVEWLVEEKIDAEIEIAGDGYFVGDFADTSLNGVEIKDACYLGIVQETKKLPEQIRTVNTALAPVLRKDNYANLFACELRIQKDGTPIPIDPTCRVASPAGESQLATWANFPEIVYAGAHGELLQPEVDDQCVAQAMIFNEDDERDWCPVEIPEKCRPNVTLYYAMRRGREDYVVPQRNAFAEIGSITCTGPTPEKAIERVEEIAEQIDGDIKVRTDELPEALKEFELMDRVGMNVEPIAA